jgi:hypothetical protein
VFEAARSDSAAQQWASVFLRNCFVIESPIYARDGAGKTFKQGEVRTAANVEVCHAIRR